MRMGLLLGFFGVLSVPVFADGFRCYSWRDDLYMKWTNHVHPEHGTRVGAVAVFSDARFPDGTRTIAVAKEDEGTLSNKNFVYEAIFDLQALGISAPPRKFIGDFPIMRIDRIIFKPRFNYAMNLRNKAWVQAEMEIVFHSGFVIPRKSFDLRCRYYKKLPWQQKVAPCEPSM